MENLSSDRRFLDLLQNWWAGDFRRTDQRELDALTGSDEFRREAFEGFEENSEAVSKPEISAIRARFEKKYRRQTGRSVPLTWALAAAAMGLLVIATVWIFNGFSGQAGDELAISQTAQPTENQAVESKPEATQPALSPEMSEAKPAADYSISSEKSTGQAGSGRPSELAQKEIQPSAGAIKSNDELADNDSKFSEKMVAAGAAETEPTAVHSPKMEAKKDLEMAKMTAPKPAKASHLPADRNVFQNDSNYPTAPQNADSRALEKRAESRKKQEEIRTPEPEMGWPAWKNWLAENQKLPESARISSIRGEVKLKFYVDKNGQPTQIFIVKSPGSEFETEAIRLLQTGPKWTVERGEVQLSIEF